MAERAVLTPEERRGREQREVQRWDGLRASGAELRRELRATEAQQLREDGVTPAPQKARDEAAARP